MKDLVEVQRNINLQDELGDSGMKTEYSSAVYSTADCNFKNISSVYKISISLELNLKVIQI